MNSVEDHVIPQHQAPQIGIHFVRERTPQARVIGQPSNPPAEVLHHTPSHSRILLRDEIEDLRNPLQSGI